MNYIHRVLCSSAKWKSVVQQYALPWTLEKLDLGDDVVEIGPGYGAATEVLQKRARNLVCLESDHNLANRLARCFNDGVTVRCEDATDMTLPSESSQSVVCFNMLHHIDSPELQDRLFREVARVLKPGGVFAGTDSLKSRFMKLIHLFDTLVLVDPETLKERLSMAGFENVQVDVNPYAFRFRAWKPERWA